MRQRSQCGDRLAEVFASDCRSIGDRNLAYRGELVRKPTGGGITLRDPTLRSFPFQAFARGRRFSCYHPSHSGLRGRSMVFTFSSLIVPFLTRSFSGASVAPATFMR